MVTPGDSLWQKRWNQLVLVLEELAGLVSANVPLAAGCLALAQDAPNRRLSALFTGLHDDLANGFALHEAMQHSDNFFPSYCSESVRAGEESGRLAEVLRDLAANLMESLSFRSRTQQVGAYLFIVLFVESLILLALLTFVMPQMQEIFTAYHRSLPFMARLLVSAQHLYLPHLLLACAMGVPILWGLTQLSALSGGPLSRRFDAAALRLPFLRRKFLERHLGNAAAVAEVLLSAGIPLHKAFHAAAEASAPVPVRLALLRVAAALEQGTSLGEAMLRERSIVPEAFREIVALGEASGELPKALRQLKELYRQRSMRNARLALDIGGPVLLCFIGGIVFIVWAGFFQWLTELPQLVNMTP